MKLVPGPLPPIPTSGSMDRLPLPLPFGADSLLWRYPFGIGLGQPPSSPLMDYKSQLPSSLASDPRVWSREDVLSFLKWAEREFDLQPIDLENFQMNGKAICLLNRTDLSERAPPSGDILYNIIQILVREANSLRMLPSSPVTPTSRHPYPLSPHSHPPTPNWNILTQGSDPFHSSHAASLAVHLMAQSNSVTLSPAPSVDSQGGGSPQRADNAQSFGHSIFNNSTGTSNGSNSNPSDSDEDQYEHKFGASGSPPSTPSAFLPNPMAFMNSNGNSNGNPKSPKEFATSPMYKREFWANESPEPNTNGRLLWDFLQQLLNDPQQRYTNYIAWKNHDTGVFKIVDPAGLAKLWGIQKNHLSMNYDKMSRALRYYYRVNILRKVQGERHCYQFLRNPSELKNIKNISLLRQMSPTNTKPPQITPQIVSQIASQMATPHMASQIVPNVTIKPEPLEITEEQLDVFDEKPTDLSISMETSASTEGPTDLSSNSRQHVNIVCSPDPPIIPPIQQNH